MSPHTRLKKHFCQYQSLGTIDEASCETQRSLEAYRMRTFCRLCTPTFKRALAVLIPIILSPFLFNGSKEARCAFVILLMAMYWMFEVVHLSVTSLLPVVLFPMLGIMTTAEASMPYMKDTIMLYLAGMVMAGAVERCNLHNRIALKILLFVGGKIHWLMLGFMTTSMCMSMWVSNMATTLMLLPIADAVIDEYCTRLGDTPPHLDSSDHELHSAPSEGSRNDSGLTPGKAEEDDRSTEKNRRKLQHCMLLGVAYAANLGGTGTLIGTAPNIVMFGIMEEQFPEANVLSFATWMLYNIPPMIVCVLLAWIYLYVMDTPKKFKAKIDEKSAASIRDLIAERYRSLGPISFHEAAVVSLFGVLILLWFFRDPRIIPGWTSVIPHGRMIKDATPAIGIIILMFLIPSDPCRNFGGPALIDWKYTQAYVPWGVLLLMGGSFSMAVGADKSGLSRLVGESIVRLGSLPPLALLIVLTVGTAFITELCSNTATASVLLPMTAYLATALKINPIKLMMPVTIASSFAFMLPVATPPNAMVYEHSDMSIMYMVRCGFFMNVVCVFVELVAISTLGDAIFDLSHFPAWAANATRFSFTLQP